MDGPLTSATSIWFEIWGSWIQVKKIRFSRQIYEKFQFFQAISQKIRFFQANFREISTFSSNFTKNSIFPGKFSKNSDISRQFFKNFDFPGKTCSFTAISGQISLIALQKSPLSNILPIHNKI